MDIHDFPMNINVDVIRKDPKNQDWQYISYQGPLTEEFILEFKDYVDWYYITKYQKLSEDFLDKCNESEFWRYYAVSDNISLKILSKYLKKLQGNFVIINEKITREFIVENHSFINFSNLLKHGYKFTDDAIDYCRMFL